MITGDNVLTAIHVAHVLKFIRKNRTALILDQPTGFTIIIKILCSHFDKICRKNGFGVRWMEPLVWRRTYFWPKTIYWLDPTNLNSVWLALHLNIFRALMMLENSRQVFKICFASYCFLVLYNIRVYARMSPKQKERAINSMKAMGSVTLMCGDG